jgi:hypothetical protein
MARAVSGASWAQAGKGSAVAKARMHRRVVLLLSEFFMDAI